MPKVASSSAQGTELAGDVAQVIHLGASQDRSYEAAGGTSQRAGAFVHGILRLVLEGTSSVRIKFGDATVVATATSAKLLPGEVYFGVNEGEYLAVIGNDAATGSLNITQAG